MAKNNDASLVKGRLSKANALPLSQLTNEELQQKTHDTVALIEKSLNGFSTSQAHGILQTVSENLGALSVVVSD